MKLFIFEHCPYCCRARMPLELFGIDCELDYLLNDDVETPTNLIGKKAVPILQKDNGEAMGESLDIVAYFDKIYNEEKPLNTDVREEIKQWLDANHKLINYLYMPRCIDSGFPEFNTDDAKHYFIKKKEDYIGLFSEHKANTKTYLHDIKEQLHQLESIVDGESWLNDEFSYEDIHLFPILRNLTLVDGVEWPSKIREYLEFVSKKTKLPLFFDRKIK